MTTDNAQDVTVVPAPAVTERTSSRWSWLSARVLPPLFAGVGFLALVEIVVSAGLVSDIVLPRPSDVAQRMYEQVQTAHLWSNMWVTIQEGLWGFVIGSVIGFVLGVAIGLSQTIARATYPYVVLIQSMPRVALAPVFVALLGFGQGAKIWTAVAICFFPLLINTIIGLRQVNENELMMMRAMCATKFQIFRKLLLPNAMPMIFGGLKTNMTLAMLGAIVGELTAANAGVGMLIESAAFQLRMDAVFSYILLLSFVSLALFGVLELIDRRVVFWKEDVKKEIVT